MVAHIRNRRYRHVGIIDTNAGTFRNDPIQGDPPMILVTGANGHLGRAIVERLLERAPAREIAVSVRNPENASDLAARGVVVRKGDFAQPETLARAFAGASQILFVSSNAAAYGGNTMAQHRTAIDAARVAGVQRVVYTSHQAAAAKSEFFPARDHAATEELLRTSGVAWTSLRNGFYASSALDYLIGRAFYETGVIEAPADGKVSWTDRGDLATAAAAILLDESQYDGPTAPLTGSQAVDFAHVAGLASEILGRPIQRKVISDDEYRAKVASTGAVPEAAEFLLKNFYRPARKGEFNVVDPTLERLLGRRPTTLRDLIARANASRAAGRI
jgi:NAD(P)H dehydrogenase (quinone)